MAMTGGLEETKDRERAFHDSRYGKDEGKRPEHVFYRASFDLENAFLECMSRYAPGKDVLDYGCGTGSRCIELAGAFKTARVSGIDLSDRAIEIAQKRAADAGVKIDLSIQDCHSTNLAGGKFDLIYGNGILHHLDLSASITEIRRLLRPDGVAVFYEPMGTNPLINLYRSLTPKSRSSDEHPFLPSDIALIRTHFPGATFQYFGFFTLIFLPFYRIPKDSKIFRLGAWLDRKLLSLPLIRRFAWSVLIAARA